MLTFDSMKRLAGHALCLEAKAAVAAITVRDGKVADTWNQYVSFSSSLCLPLLFSSLVRSNNLSDVLPYLGNRFFGITTNFASVQAFDNQGNPVGTPAAGGAAAVLAPAAGNNANAGSNAGGNAAGTAGGNAGGNAGNNAGAGAGTATGNNVNVRLFSLFTLLQQRKLTFLSFSSSPRSDSPAHSEQLPSQSLTPVVLAPSL